MARQEPLSPEVIAQGAASLPAPAAGADWVFTVPGQLAAPASGVDFLVVSARALLTASGSAGNRRVTIEVQDAAGNKLYDVCATTDQIVSQAVAYSLGAGLPPQGAIVTAAAGNLQCVLGIPNELVVRPGWKLLSVTAGILAGDQWSAVALNVARF